jgi:hypothetical protein
MNVEFAKYPSLIGEKCGIAIVDEEWLVKEQVEDFNWLRKQHSPNWRISKETITDDTWSTVLKSVKEEDINPQSILELVM